MSHREQWTTYCSALGDVTLMSYFPFSLSGTIFLAIEVNRMFLNPFTLMVVLGEVTSRHDKVTSGLGEVIEGLGKLTAGLGEVTAGLSEVTAGLGKLTAGLGEVNAGLDEVTVTCKVAGEVTGARAVPEKLLSCI